MNKCEFCGREGNCNTKIVGGYRILEVCSDCDFEIENPEEHVDRLDECLIGG